MINGSQKPLSQVPLAAGMEVGRRIPITFPGSTKAGEEVNEGVASLNPTRGGAFAERDGARYVQDVTRMAGRLA